MTAPMKRDADATALADTAAALSDAEDALKRAVMTHALRLPIQDRLVRQAARARDMRRQIEAVLAAMSKP